jgi:signal peptidase I
MRCSLSNSAMKRILGWILKPWASPQSRNLVAILCAGIIGLAAGKNWLGSVCIVTGPSMVPTFQEGAHLYTTPLAAAPGRGDIVILEDGTQSYAIKRVVGLPGETVTIWRGYVYINNRILLEPYVPKRTYTFPRQRQAVFELGSDQYFVLGDNRPCSADSRLYGGVALNKIKRRISETNTLVRAHFGPLLLTPLGEAFRRPSVPNQALMSQI